MRVKITITFLFGCFLILNTTSFAKDAKKEKHRTRSIYGSWGYNEEWYTPSTIHVKEDALGDNYDLVHVRAQDHKGWDNGIFNKALTIPQYNYRLGCYFNDKQDLAIELNFDHTKFVIPDGQSVHFSGTHDHAPINENIPFLGANGFYYYLNNGANFFLFNLVKRLGLYNTRDNKLRIDLTGKAGVGPVIPHVENSFFNHANDPHFQFGGWNTGVETALRVTIMRYVFFEFSQKVDYARYSNLKIYEGTAKQNFGTYELILSGGIIIPTTKHNPMFQSSEHKAMNPALGR